MLLKYVVSWNELAIAYQHSSLFYESLEAFRTAIDIYTKLNMKIHQSFAIANFYMSKVYIMYDSYTPEGGVINPELTPDNPLNFPEAALVSFEYAVDP